MPRLPRALALPLAVLLATAARGDPAPAPGERRAVVARRADFDDAPSLGPRGAPVTVEVFCSPGYSQCPHTYANIRALAERHPRGLRAVYRQIAWGDKQLAEAAVEAHVQGRFLELLERFGQSRPPRQLERIAREAGMDVDALRAALDDHRHLPTLERDETWAVRLGVEGPALVWNGIVQPHISYGVDSLEERYLQAHRRARAALDEGVPIDRLYAELLRRADAERAALHASDRRDRSAPPVDPRRVHVRIGDAPARGDPDAPVTIVFFSELDGRTANLDDRLRRTAAAYRGRLRLVYKHFPNPERHNARDAAIVAACAHLQGQFWAFHDRVASAGGNLRRDDLLARAAAIGLDAERLLADYQSGRCAERVDADVAEGQALGLERPPAVFVNGLRLQGTSTALLRRLIDDELRPGLLEALSGP